MVRDLKMASRLQSRLRLSIQKSPRILVAAAINAGAVSAGALTSRPECTWDERREGSWVKLSLPGTSDSNPLMIDYHPVTGTLLVDGKPVERELPPRLRGAHAIAHLFPNQRLVVYASSLFGMTYKVAFNPDGQEVHLGFRQGDLIVRAWTQNGLWEYIPAGVFEANGDFDLPALLTVDCVHWLHLQSNIIEVRKMTRIWKSATGNWNINLNTCMATRRNCTLLEPRSDLFQHFTSIFRGFEDPRHIAVYQPAGCALVVDLRRYELSFNVRSDGILECPQLQATVDQDQDPGTWYGLSSKLVLRNLQNPSQRSIIVPLGPLIVRRRGIHVDVEIQKIDPVVVGHFFLDTVLGRVTCASEPRLFYTKALLHACTSFCLPDRLTGKTGADEACHILATGSCQPYAPLTEFNKMLLNDIAELTPKRRFYPEDLCVMESVTWRDNLTPCIQDNRYWHLINAIRQKSDVLTHFALNENAAREADYLPTTSALVTADRTNSHLMLRGRLRQLTYQSSEMSSVKADAGSSDDVQYRVRGHDKYKKSQHHVFEVARLIHDWPDKLPSTALLHLTMQRWPHIAGYGDGIVSYDKIRLSDHLDVDIASSWGPLVNSCRLSGRDTKYKLLLLLATIAFRDEIDLPALRTLVAFSIFQDLKKIDLPSWPSYTQFRPGFVPKFEYLRRLLGSCIMPFTGGSQVQSTQRERRAVEAARRAHDSRGVQDLDFLINFMCAQWPCPRPDLEHFSTSTLDLTAALSLVAIEWHAMFQNHEFEEHLRQVQNILDKYRTSPPARNSVQTVTSPDVVVPRGSPVWHDSLLNKNGPQKRHSTSRLLADHRFVQGL